MGYGCNTVTDTSEPAQEWVIPAELQDINYDEMIKQLVNVAMVVGSVYGVLVAAKSVGLSGGVLARPMGNVLRTSMLAGVVLPILIQQLRNMIVEGGSSTPKVVRNVAVAGMLTYVLLMSSARDVMGAPLFGAGANVNYLMPRGNFVPPAFVPARP
tara:strand:+ start:686 stop:1153 length:468 start_codon:yes stop_codon:yes gene_type:complete